MKCYKCNKQIPAGSTICPYCSTPVDVSYKQEIEFGDINNIDYDNKNDLKTYIHEPKDHKTVIIAFVSTILVFFIFAFLASIVLFPTPERLDVYFIKMLDNINDYTKEKYFQSSNAMSGEYRLNLTINGETHELTGRYEKDLEKRIFNLNGIIKDSNEQTGGVILDSKEFSFDASMNDNNIYFKSEQLFSSYLNFEISDDIGLLTNKECDLDILLGGIYKGLRNSLIHVDYHRENTKINYRGLETKTNRYYFVLDNKEKINFIRNFYNSLIDNNDFINEYAHLKDKNSNEVIELFNNKITEAETKYNAEDDCLMTFSIYVNNKKIIRYYIDIIDGEEHKVYQLDIKEGKYFFDYFLNDKNEISSTLVKTEETIDGIKNINYSITFDNDEYVMDIVLDFKIDAIAKVEKRVFENYRDFKTITEDEKNILKTNLLKYTNRDDLIDKLDDYFKEKCVLGLDCLVKKTNQLVRV